MKKRAILVILDGFGYRTDQKDNAIAESNMPFWEGIWQHNHALLDASGLAVGLPNGQMGNSEVGHMTIGSGRAIDTDLVRIGKSISSGEFYSNSTLLALSSYIKTHNTTLHIFGLLSPGGVHSHSDHIHALVQFCKRQSIQKVAIHVITDGRDTAPQSAASFIEELEHVIETEGVGNIVSVVGRYYAMDRDNNWDRIQKATSAMFTCEGERCSMVKPSEKLREAYSMGTTDEFLEPLVFLHNEQGTQFEEGDGAIFINFRADRARQLAHSISKIVAEKRGMFVTMTEYEAGQSAPSLFPPEKISDTLSDVLAGAGYSQAHIAETEKYAHATYFFNGGIEQLHPGESFILIESRKDVKTHDLAPEMKAHEITDKALEALKSNTDFMMINYANADMVGHSGNKPAILKAVECLDVELSRLCSAATEHGVPVLISADHGNAEENVDPATGEIHTAHTTNFVPVVLVGDDRKLHDGDLTDIAPTILELLGLDKPHAMTGKSLLS